MFILRRPYFRFTLPVFFWRHLHMIFKKYFKGTSESQNFGLVLHFNSKSIVFLPWKAWDWMEVNLEHPEMSNLLSCEQTGVRASEARVSKGFLSRCMEWRLGTLLKASEGTSDRLLSPSLRLRSVPNPLKAKLCTSAILHWFISKRVRLKRKHQKR